MPSYLEPFGLTVIESLACGTPVIGRAVGGIKEILSGLDRRLLFKGHSPEAMAKGILAALGSNLLTPSFRRRCRRYATENFSWDAMVRSYESLYKELLRR